MDIGDILRLIFFGVIFLSFFGGSLGKKKDKQEKPDQSTNLPQHDEASQPAPVSHPPRSMIDPVQAASEQEIPQPRREPERTQPAMSTDTIRDSVADRSEERRQEILARLGEVPSRDTIRSSERSMLERDLTDTPPPMDLYPERKSHRHRRRAGASRHRSRITGAEILRGWLEDPDALGRAFIVKEVLDEPVGMRRRHP